MTNLWKTTAEKMDIHKVFHRKCGKIYDKYQIIKSFPPSVEKEIVENYHVEN